MFHPEGPTLRELVVQGLSSTRRGYDLLAPKFDLTPFRTPHDLLAQVVEAIEPVDRALDVCCGTGAAMIALKPLCDEVVGIDFSPGMLGEAERRVARAPGRGRASFVRGDVLQMEFEQAFDLAVSFGAFGHFMGAQQGELLRRVHAALRPGGRFVFVTSEKPRRLSRERMLLGAFNLSMRLRNRLIRPPFVMYYLHFTVPEILPLLDRVGFDVEVAPLGLDRRPSLRKVTAVRRGA